MALDSPDDQVLAIKWMRALSPLAGQYRLLTKDTDLDETESDLELLQAAKEGQSDD